jgi:hypothetical protein
VIDLDVKEVLVATLGDEWENKVSMGFVPEDVQPPYIFYQRRSSREELWQSSPGGNTTSVFAIEIWSSNVADPATISQQLRYALNGYQGDFGDAWAWQVEVSDQEDDYQTIGKADGDGIDFSAVLTLSIIHKTTVD